MAITRLIASSPFVIMLNIALRSAQIPNVHDVSTQTPTYILPDTDSTAAETPPAPIISETSRGFYTCFAASYNSFHLSFIDLSSFTTSNLLHLFYFILNVIFNYNVRSESGQWVTFL